jgi:hypothetical protein
MPGVIAIGDLLNSLGSGFTDLDARANRARTGHAQQMKDLARMGLTRQRELSDSFANAGNVHSGANLQAQTDLNSTLDSYRASANQQLEDILADVGRKKLQSSTAFQISSLLPG